MAKYVSLYRYIGAIEGGGPERFAKVRGVVEAENCQVLDVYGLLGAYDVMAVVECPDNATAMKVSAKVGNLIGARSQTMPAVDRDDFLQLLTEV